MRPRRACRGPRDARARLHSSLGSGGSVSWTLGPGFAAAGAVARLGPLGVVHAYRVPPVPHHQRDQQATGSSSDSSEPARKLAMGSMACLSPPQVVSAAGAGRRAVRLQPPVEADQEGDRVRERPGTHITPAGDLLVGQRADPAGPGRKRRVVAVDRVRHEHQRDRQHPADDHRAGRVGDPRPATRAAGAAGPGSITRAQNSRPVKKNIACSITCTAP